MERQPWAEDDPLLLELGAALRDGRSAPDVVVSDGRAAWSWRTVDTELELATLVYDSTLEEAAAVRGAEPTTGPRLLVFEGAGVSLEVEVGDGSLVGQLLPPVQGEVGLVAPDGSVVTERTDDAGCFTLRLPAGPVRLRARTADGHLTTEWLRP